MSWLPGTAVNCPRCRAEAASYDDFCRHCGSRLLPPAGWYPNPDGHGGLRYWDGRVWTEQTHAVPDVASVADPEEPATAPRGAGVAVAAFAVGAAASYGVLELLHRLGRPGGRIVALLASEAVLWAALLGAAWFVSRQRGTGSFRRDYGWGFRRADLGIGALGAVIGRSTTVIVVVPLYGAFHDLLRSPTVSTLPGRPSAALLVTFALVACVGAPLVEELFFRGLLQTRLVARFGAVRGIAVTSVLFGAAHLIGWRGPASLLAAAAIAGGGTVLGYLRHRTGRLGTSMVAHGIFNAFAVALVAAGVGR